MKNVVRFELVVNHRPKCIQKRVWQIDIVVDRLFQAYIEPYLLTYLLYLVVKPVIFGARDITIDCLED